MILQILKFIGFAFIVFFVILELIFLATIFGLVNDGKTVEVCGFEPCDNGGYSGPRHFYIIGKSI